MKRSKASVAAEVGTLPSLSLRELRDVWRKHYGTPPNHRSANLLRRVLAWKIQADAFGGFDAETKRLIAVKGNQQPKAQPGERLSREWAGRRHEVVITSNGVIYEDETFRTLSEVARHITGTRWNGPRFFGLREVNSR